MTIPKLYKYRYFNEDMVFKSDTLTGDKIPQWQQVLYDGLIFPALPKDFNDPFDCEFVLEDGYVNSAAFTGRIIRELSKFCPLSETEKANLYTTNDPEETLRAILWKHFRRKDCRKMAKQLLEVPQTAMKTMKDALRVACFSEDNTSLLMWSHYAWNHKGFCIEYDFNNSAYSKHLKPVQYTKDRHFISKDFRDGSNRDFGNSIIAAALYKSDVWDYEKEWRLVIGRNDSLNPQDLLNPQYIDKIPYLCLKDFITAVYIGAKADQKYCLQICEHYCGSDVKVYQMQMQTDCYKLKPIQIQ